jgi:hypothetical protein
MLYVAALPFLHRLDQLLPHLNSDLFSHLRLFGA